MTLDRPNKTPHAGPAITATAPRWAGKTSQTPSSARSSGPSRASTLRKEEPDSGSNVTTMGSMSNGATPVKAFMCSNITPRSGSRKARVESASSTPRRTPESASRTARPLSMIEGREWPSAGPTVTQGHGTRADSSRPTRAQSVASNVQHPDSFTSKDSNRNRGLRTATPECLPKFFHADDAKPGCHTRTQSQSPRLQPRTVVHNNTNGISNLSNSTPLSSPEPDDEPPRFFHADGTQPTSPPAARLVNGAFSARPPLPTIFSSYQTTSSPVQRPSSPLKEEVLPVSRRSSLSKPSPRRHTRLVSSGSNDIRVPDTVVTAQSSTSRRSSLNDPARKSNTPQSPVVASFGIATSRRSSLAMSDYDPQPAEMPSAATITSTSPTASVATTSPTFSSSEGPTQPAPGQSKLDHLNELAANARRERKVLDLEISNSSLLAINRTLEAEMRKQKAELRHLRRLRSTGHFPSSTRSASSKFSIPSVSDDHSDTSSADEDGVDDDRFSNVSSGTSDGTSFPDSLSFSPTLRNSSLPVPKGRTSRSFKLDLSAQRSLLLDSQRLNQSLKRCLGRTDELIADGKKALSYKVNIDDIATLGPRVLTPEERDGEMELGRGLLSPSLQERSENPFERMRKVGDAWAAPQARCSEGLVLDIPVREDQDQIVGQAQLHDEQVLQQSNQHTDMETLVEDLRVITGTGTPAPEVLDIDTAQAYPPSDNSSPDMLEIPYEDPGIDTGSETPALENDTQQDDLAPETSKPSYEAKDETNVSAKVPVGIREESVEPELDEAHTGSTSGDSSEGEELRISSPSKGLGDFLRMVGGSWGV